MSEVAAAMEISEQTAAQLCTYVKAWLPREIQGTESPVEKNKLFGRVPTQTSHREIAGF